MDRKFKIPNKDIGKLRKANTCSYFLITKIIQNLSEQGSWPTSTLLALLSRSLSFSYCPFESKVDICWCKISSYHNGTMAHLPYIITKLVRIIDDLCVGHIYLQQQEGFPSSQKEELKMPI